jgi:hypothetical protein
VTAPPCGDGASRAELGAPFVGGPAAEFTTAGGTVYVAVERFDHGGAFDPATGTATVYVGPADRPPTYDRQTGAVGNARADVHVEERTFAALTLEPGRYWLWTTNGSGVVVMSCDPGGVSDGRRA